MSIREGSIIKAKVMSPKTSRGSSFNTKYKSMKKLPQEDKKTSLFSLHWLQVKRSTKNQITTGLLVVALFLERYCFLVTVYKTKYFGYMTILTVIFFNTIFNAFIMKIRHHKHQRVFHELFNIERGPKVSLITIGFLG